jgi:hypothetical protein
MKSYLFIVILLLTSTGLFSQIMKNDFLLSLDGNYVKTYTENGASTNQSRSQIEQLVLGPSIGIFVTDHIAVGAGLDYIWSKEKINSILCTDNITYIQREYMETTSNAFIPNVYMGYYYPVINKLFMSARLKVSYGQVKSDEVSIVAGFYNNSGAVSEDPSSYIYSSSYNKKYDYFSANISPELTYFIGKRFGLCLGLGGVEYALPDWETGSSSWDVNFDPSNWTLGFRLDLYQ